jgi:hypothetical protein
MSLINDALRQASQADKQQTAWRPPPEVPTPAEPAPEPLPVRPMSPWPSLVRLMIVVILGVGVLGGGGFWLFKTWSKHRQTIIARTSSMIPSVPPFATAKTGSTQVLAQATTPPKVKNPPAAIAPPPEAPAQAQPSAGPVLASNAPVVADPKPAPAVFPPVKWPPLRLQGIFYRPPNSSVVINNKTLFVDEEIQGVRIARIDRRGVTLFLDGQTNVLILR